MEENTVECEMAEREGAACGCGGAGASLGVLRDVQRAYEARLALLCRSGAADKLQKQVQLLQSWVSDLVGQNALLARAVEELEGEVTSRLLLERRRHAEMECEVRAEAAALRRRLARKDADLRGLLEVLRRLREPAHPRRALDTIHFNEVTQSDIFGNDLWQENQLDQGDDKSKKSCDKLKETNETLQKEIITKDREIRRLNKDAQHYEQTIISLRKEMSLSQYHTPDVSKLDAEVTADICCPGMQIGDITPVKDYTFMLRSEYQERLQHMEDSLKSSAESVRALRETNVSLSKELHSLRQLCAALGEQCRAFAVRAEFRDELVREMRRQLRHAKTKLKEASEASCPKTSRETMSAHEVSRDPCVRQQPRRARPWDCATPSLLASGDEISLRAE